MTIQYALIPEDHRAFSRYYRRQSEYRRKILVNGGMLTAVALVAFFVSYFRQRRSAITAQDWLIISLAVIALAVLMFAAVVVGTRIWEAWRLRRIPASGPPLTLTIAPEGVRVVSEDGDSTTHWHAFLKIDTTPTHHLIFYQPAYALLIPRRAFDDEAQYQLFWHQMQQLYQDALRIRIAAKSSL